MTDKQSADTIKKVLFTALSALRDYLDDIVIVGGWVPQIYAWKEDSSEIAIHSNDVDAAVAPRLPVRGNKAVAALMDEAGFDVGMADSGFNLAAFGKKKHQVTRFFYREGKLAVPFEFITPLIGSEENTPIVIQTGLVVPALRYTDILLAHNVTVTIRGETLAGRKESFTFKIPTLPAFVFAKGLIFDQRDNIGKKGKDLAYIYEALKRPEWRKKIIAGMPETTAKHPAGWYKTFKRQLGIAFEGEGATGPAWIALQYQGREPAETRKDAFETFRSFLAELK